MRRGSLLRALIASALANDRESHVGKLDKALDAAPANHWLVVSMQKDWKRIFGFQQ
jgi:hypothetical protein